MLHSFYLFTLWVQIVTALGGALLSYLIVRMVLAPTFTYSILAISFIGRFIEVIPRLIKYKKIVLAQGAFSLPLVISTQAFGMLVTIGFFIFILRQYASYRRHGIGNIQTLRNLNSYIAKKVIKP